jgi:hypothetical protein
MQRTTSEAFDRKRGIKVMRRRAVEHELHMYAAISGKAPGISPPPQGARRVKKVRISSGAASWSAAVLAAHLANLSMPRLAILLKRPRMADWLRRLSTQALDRLAEAQVRLAAARQRSRDRFRDNGAHFN